MVARRGRKGRNHQLPHAQAGARRSVLRAHLRTHQGLGVQLRKIQAHALSRALCATSAASRSPRPRFAASAWVISSWPRRSATSGISRAFPSRMGTLLKISPRALEQVLYFASLHRARSRRRRTAGEASAAHRSRVSAQAAGISRDRETGEAAFRVGIGAEAVREMLREIDLDQLAEELQGRVRHAVPQGNLPRDRGSEAPAASSSAWRSWKPSARAATSPSG